MYVKASGPISPRGAGNPERTRHYAGDEIGADGKRVVAEGMLRSCVERYRDNCPVPCPVFSNHAHHGGPGHIDGHGEVTHVEGLSLTVFSG